MSTTNNNSTNAPLTLRQYWTAVGTDNARKVAEKSGTTWQYMRTLVYSATKRPSYKLALAIIKAADEITPGWAPDLHAMLGGPKEPRGRKTSPSPEFLASQQQRQQQATEVRA